MRKRYVILGSCLVIATITIICLSHYANRDHYVIRVVNSTNRQIEHVQVLGLDEVGDFGVLLPGASKSVDLEGKAPTKSISLSFERIEGKAGNTGMIIEPMSVIAGQLITLQINDASVSASPRALTLRERLKW